MRTGVPSWALPTESTRTSNSGFSPADLRAALPDRGARRGGWSHPGIVVVHDVGRDTASGLLFMGLEYLDGETLAE
jgi:hypothetical protein